jgi:hypothetical protein
MFVTTTKEHSLLDKLSTVSVFYYKLGYGVMHSTDRIRAMYWFFVIKL